MTINKSQSHARTNFSSWSGIENVIGRPRFAKRLRILCIYVRQMSVGVMGQHTSCQIQFQLPTFRVQSAYPFAVKGIDYTGAIRIWIKGSKSCRICLNTLVCGIIKHNLCSYPRNSFGAVADKSTESFVNVFRSYTEHHPLPRLIVSNNASTFIVHR